MGMKFRRRNYLTKKTFQARFMLPFLLASLLANIITVTLFIALARSRMDDMLFSMRLPRLSAGSLLTPLATAAHVAAIAAVSLLFLWAARGMHRKISGPLGQIRADLRKIQSGDLSCRVTLRDADEFKDFAGEINTMTSSLQARFTELQAQANEMSGTADGLQSPPASEEFRAARARMQELLQAMDRQIRSFTL